MNSFEKIYTVVASIPKGKVMTYKSVSLLANVANPRIVGYALHANTTPATIPCHRVIKSDGSVAKGYAFGGPEKQKALLENEGVRFAQEGKVDLSQFEFIPQP